MAVTEALVESMKKELIVTGILAPIFFFANVAYSQESYCHVDSTDSKSEILFAHEIDTQKRDNDQFLLLASLGQKFSVEGRYKESNQYFEKAYFLLVDHPGNRFNEKVECYEDDHDLFMVLYFKAINYLCLGLAEEALVECRRMDEWLRESNQHQARKFAARDPLVYVIMGLIYEAGGEFDNSFISYNQAKQLYQQDYQGLFSKEVPVQLERDINYVSSAAERQERSTAHGEMIFIWHNGQCPLKLNSHKNFKIKCHDGDLTSSNPTWMPQKDYLGNLLLPFYTIRKPNFWSGTLVANGKDFHCELLEDITWQSVKTLQDRLNQNGTHFWRHGQEWYTLPYTINYVRVPLVKGTNRFDFIIHGYGGSMKTDSFSCEGNGRTNFHLFTSLDSYDAYTLNK
jgi:hypothetical protein